MKLNIIAVGKNMPSWVTTGFNEYEKRFRKPFEIVLTEITALKRNKNSNIEKLKYEEEALISAQLQDNALTIVLDEHGQEWDTKSLANKINHWQTNYRGLNILIGGPDGFSSEFLSKHKVHWSLSKLTLPHPLVRIVLIEQLYRGFTILDGHPYHRE